MDNPLDNPYSSLHDQMRSEIERGGLTPWDEIVRDQAERYGSPEANRGSSYSNYTSEIEKQRNRLYQSAINVGGSEEMTKVSTARFVDSPAESSPAESSPAPEPNEEKSKKSAALVRPEDITDAADSTDLLESLLEENLTRIEDKNDLRMRMKWASEQRDKKRAEYFSKANKAYEQMWTKCAGSAVGHNFVTIDSGGLTLKTCQVCSFSTHTSAAPTGEREFDFNRKMHKFNEEKKVAEQMNIALVEALKKKMIEVDEDASILHWTTEDDYQQNFIGSLTSSAPKAQEGSSKVRGWFGNK